MHDHLLKVLDEDGKWENLDDLDENDKPPPPHEKPSQATLAW